MKKIVLNIFNKNFSCSILKKNILKYGNNKYSFSSVNKENE